MQFYKQRFFGELISDTFDFVKKYGENYFKNYFIVNGAVLILLLVVVVLGYGELFQQMFSSNMDGQQFYFEQYFSENQGVFIGVTLLALVLAIMLSLISYTFPVLYMKRLAEEPSTIITSSQMIEDMKEEWGKIVIFGLGVAFIIMPIGIVLFFLSGLLMLIIIGFFLLLILVPIIMNIMNFTMFNYFNTKEGFLNSVKFAVYTQFSNNFFKYLGSTVIIYFVIQIISTIFTMIPMLFYVGAIFVDSGNEPLDESDMMMTITFIVYTVSILASFIASNLLYINAGFMYYDAKKELHKDVQLSEIDLIGKGEA
ncbi:hypothetical protein GO491_09020 [Flavobacteriaceae bacterium Ap0902]|nr:hypothetical protein [Flavobacteriaceae bacterium Ap0902]